MKSFKEYLYKELLESNSYLDDLKSSAEDAKIVEDLKADAATYGDEVKTYFNKIKASDILKAFRYGMKAAERIDAFEYIDGYKDIANDTQDFKNLQEDINDAVEESLGNTLPLVGPVLNIIAGDDLGDIEFEIFNVFKYYIGNRYVDKLKTQLRKSIRESTAPKASIDDAKILAKFDLSDISPERKAEFLDELKKAMRLIKAGPTKENAEDIAEAIFQAAWRITPYESAKNDIKEYKRLELISFNDVLWGLANILGLELDEIGEELLDLGVGEKVNNKFFEGRN